MWWRLGFPICGIILQAWCVRVTIELTTWSGSARMRTQSPIAPIELRAVCISRRPVFDITHVVFCSLSVYFGPASCSILPPVGARHARFSSNLRPSSLVKRDAIYERALSQGGNVGLCFVRPKSGTTRPNRPDIRTRHKILTPKTETCTRTTTLRRERDLNVFFKSGEMDFFFAFQDLVCNSERCSEGIVYPWCVGWYRGIYNYPGVRRSFSHHRTTPLDFSVYFLCARVHLNARSLA